MCSRAYPPSSADAVRVGIDATFLEAGALHSGMGVYTRGLVSALAAEPGLAPDLVLLSYERPQAAPPELAWYPLPRLRVGKLSAWLSHQVLLGRAARRCQLDLLHVPGVNVRLSRPGVPLLTSCPLVVTLHDVIPLCFYNGRLGPKLPWKLTWAVRLALLAVRRAARVITVSRSARQDILRYTSIPAERVVAIYNGLDPRPARRTASAAALAHRGVPQDYVLYAGSFEPRKNFVGAVAGYCEAVRRLPSVPPLVALVERDSGHRPAAVAALAASGVHDRVVLVDSLADDELWQLYAGARCMLYPSLYEGFGFPPLQALACGVPVVASPAGALAEVLADAPLYIDPRAPEDIARGLITVLNEPMRAASMRQLGDQVARRYRWDTCAAQTLEVYRQVGRQGR